MNIVETLEKRAALMQQLAGLVDDETVDEREAEIWNQLGAIDAGLAECEVETPEAQALALAFLNFELAEFYLESDDSPGATAVRGYITALRRNLPPIPAHIDATLKAARTDWRALDASDELAAIAA